MNRYWSLGLLFLTGVLNLFDRQIVNILAQDIKSALSLSDTELGLLTGTAFGLFYSVLGIPLGRLADRVDRVKMIVAILMLWSAFTALCGAAGNFSQLFLTRLGVGVGEAGSQPASTSLIPELFADGRRVAAMSVLLVGAPVGSFLGLWVGGYVGAVWGWRTAFVVAGIPGFVLAVLMLFTLRDPRSAEMRGSSGGMSLWVAIRTLTARPRFVWLTIGLVCSTFFVYAPGAWLPAFFIRVHGLTTAQVGRLAALAVGGGGVIGTVGAGILCDGLRVRIPDPEAKILLGALILGLPALLVTLLVADRSVALAGMFFLNICAFAYLGPIVTLIQRQATEQTRALAIAIAISTSNIFNLTVVLPLVGLLSDSLRRTQGVDAIRYALAIAGVLMAPMGMLAYWRIRGADVGIPCSSSGQLGM